MKILLLSIGSRGDIEPFLALGEMLKAKGHHVRCAFPEQFRSLAKDSNLDFKTLGSALLEMLESDDGKKLIGGSGSTLKKIPALLRLAKKSIQANKELVLLQKEIVDEYQPDQILYHIKAVYPVIWSLKNPGKAILISPVPYLHYAKDHPHIMFTKNFGPSFNKFTYSLADYGIKATIKKAAKWLGLDKIHPKQLTKALQSRKTLYTLSPALFSKPSSWNDHIKIIGYHTRKIKTDWKPTSELIQFIEKHEKILFLTFGSMTNPAPSKNTKLFLDILQKHNIPTIINTANNGLTKPKKYNSDIFYFTSNIPYEWILPKMHAMIHHGGSGTTHMSLKHGLPTLIIPHIVDQYFWNSLVVKKHAGPIGIPMNKLTSKKLEVKIIDLMFNETYKINSLNISKKMLSNNPVDLNELFT